MGRILVTYKYEGQPEDTGDGLVKELIGLLQAGGVAMTGWETIHGHEFDHHDDNHEPVLENHTIIEVRLDVNEEGLDPEEQIDWHDGGDDLFHYVLEALELGEPEIMYFYTSGDAPMQKTTIGIEIHPAF